MSTGKIECTIPLLPVRNLTTSIEFYANVLGFPVDWGDRTKPTWFRMGRTEHSLFEEFAGKGANVNQQASHQPWTCEMKLEDVDGKILRLGTGPRTDIPFDVPESVS